MIRRKLIYALLFLAIYSCTGQENSKISDKQLEKLFEQEKRNEERAKYGNKLNLEIISEPKEVERINAEIDLKLKNKETERLSASKDKSLAQRYKVGDKSVVPQLIQILKSNNLENKKEIYHNIDRSYDEPEEYSITEPELISAILENISLRDDESSVIQLAGYMELDGYEKVFEDYLLSGKANKVDRLVFWLGKKGESVETVEYVSKLIFQDNIDLDENPYILSGLEYFSENGNEVIKSRVLEICLEIYNKGIIPESRFEEIRSSWSSSNPANLLTDILFKYEDERVIPIAQSMIKKELCESEALSVLVKLEGEKYQEQVFKYLKDKNKYYKGLEPAILLYKRSQNEEIIKQILVQFEKTNEHSEYQVDKIVQSLIKMDSHETFAKLDNFLKDQSLVESIQQIYNLTNGNIEDVADDLYKFGIVQEPVNNKTILRVKSESETNKFHEHLYKLLEILSIHIWFDAEVGIVPVDYDNLLLDLSKISNGKFADIKVCMDAEVDKNYNVKYKIYLVANNKVYIATPEDIGDWYDVEIVLNLMNTALIDSGIKEKFNFIETGDQTVQIIFGPEEGVKEFVEKYKL